MKLLLLALLAATLSASAADQYITVAGAGTKDGASLANARAGSKEGFQAAWDALTPGDTLHVGAGTYAGVKISASKGGAEGKPVRLVGEGKPVFTSNFDKANPAKTGGLFLSINPGSANIEVSGLHLKGYQTGIHLRGKNANVKMTNLLIEEAREGIRSDAGATEANPNDGTHNVLVADCRFERFTKRAVRMEDGNYNWKLQRLYADAGGKEWGTEAFPICYQVSVKGDKPKDGGPAPYHGIEHDIEFTDCVALNCYFEGTFEKATPGKKAYWNGDGFCSEAGVKNLKFIRCVSKHHTDGGWDLKADSPVLIDCVSLDNKENFRFWSGTAQLTNCLSGFTNKRGGSGGAAALWTRTNVVMNFCTLIESSNFVAIDEKGAGSTVTLKNCIVAGSGKLDPAVQLENTAVPGTPEEDPRIAAKAGEWQKLTNEFDSAKFGTTKGFSSTRWTKEK